MSGRKLLLAACGVLYDLLSLLLWCPALPAALLSTKLRTYFRSRQPYGNIIRKVKAAGPCPVFIYCSSIGELEQVRPLIKRLDEAGIAHFVFLHSPNGWAHARRIGLPHFALTPPDFYCGWRVVFRHCRPGVCIINRHEAWPGFVLNAAVFSRLYLINAVEKKRNAGLSRCLAEALYALCVKTFYVNEPSSQHTRSVQTGDTRLDALKSRLETERSTIDAERLRFTAQDKQVLIVGNAYAADAAVLAAALYLQSSLVERWQILIVPTRPDMASAIRSALADWNRLITIDASMGRLFCLYQCADAAWIGGGFSRDGIHNTLEAGLHGSLMLSGPNLNEQPDAMEAAASGRLHVCGNAAECVAVLQADGRAANTTMIQKRGSATETIFRAIFQDQKSSDKAVTA